ncbi:hypothetical protein BD410DRAFT_360352 [Rickenella mellea]|uniref:Uncharacterized protein n=1 Tax=Rickenella mellea TaxID=50990 RepID=A0A4Y7Q0C8_9AGAM|nr:hypothetical protein BD410DRAFT_360352 [Rickenella mellea]
MNLLVQRTPQNTPTRGCYMLLAQPWRSNCTVKAEAGTMADKSIGLGPPVLTISHVIQWAPIPPKPYILPYVVESNRPSMYSRSSFLTLCFPASLCFITMNSGLPPSSIT